MAVVSRCSPGQTLALGSVAGPGFRSYLAVSGGVDVPAYLGSRAPMCRAPSAVSRVAALKKGTGSRIGDAPSGRSSTPLRADAG